MAQIPNTLRNSATWKRGKTFTSAPLDSALLSAELYDVDPVRMGTAYPQQRNYHGYFWMAATGKHVWHESLLERDCMMRLDFAADVVAISSQPVMLTGADGEVRYPDLLTLDARGVQTVWDVKPSSRINAKVRKQFAWTRDVCEAIGWNYGVLTEASVQYQTNLLWLAQFRHPGHHPGDAEREVLDAFVDGWTIHDAVRAMPAASAAAARSRVFHLLWSGALDCDLEERLSPRTVVKLRNGRKEFPRGIA